MYKVIEKRKALQYAGLVVIGGCAMAVQLAAHAKSGMAGRYMIPYTVAYVLIFVLTAYQVFKKDRVHKITFYIVLLCFVWSGAKTSYQQSVWYTEDGRNIALFLSEVCAQTQKDDNILCAFYDGELSLASECWLEVHDRTVVYSWTGEAFENKVQLEGNAPMLYSMENVDAALCYEWQKDTILGMLDIKDEEECELYRFGGYMLIVR